jgi:hypothetical protein
MIGFDHTVVVVLKHADLFVLGLMIDEHKESTWMTLFLIFETGYVIQQFVGYSVFQVGRFIETEPGSSLNCALDKPHQVIYFEIRIADNLFMVNTDSTGSVLDQVSFALSFITMQRQQFIVQTGMI